MLFPLLFLAIQQQLSHKFSVWEKGANPGNERFILSVKAMGFKARGEGSMAKVLVWKGLLNLGQWDAACCPPWPKGREKPLAFGM